MFWRFTIPTSQLDNLLDKEDVKLQELLDEDDVLQECKAQNKRLIDFFVKDENMEQLVDMVVTEPNDEQEEKNRFKYPNTACELLTSDVQAITEKLSSESTLVDKLYQFLDTDQPLNPLLASFVSKVMGLLITRKSQMIFEFLKEKESFVDRLLYHLDTSAIMDLLLRLITCIDNTEVKLQVLQWLNEERLIHRLASLIHHSHSESKHCNAAQSLCDIIRLGREHMSQMQEKAEPDALLQAVESTEAISELLSNMFDGESRESVITSGVSVLLTLLEKKRHGIMLECLDGGWKDNTELDEERYEASVDRTVSAVTPRLAQLHELLVKPPQQLYSPMQTSVGVLNPPLGNTRLQVTKLLVKLVECQRAQIDNTLVELGTLPTLLDLLFKYEWNSFLHGQVCSLLSCVLFSEPSSPQPGVDDQPSVQPSPLLDQLFNGCGILQRILKQWEENDDQQSMPGGHRKGYMGHLSMLANVIAKMAESETSPVVRNLIEAQEDDVQQMWTTFTSTTLAENNKRNKPDVVGGPRFSSSEDDDRDFEGITFPQQSSMQQAFSDYQVQQMTSTFTEQFGISDEDLAEQDGRIDAAFSDRLSSIDFDINTSEEQRLQAASLFEQACQDRVQKIDDPDSDEDIWEDKQKQFTYDASLNDTGSTNSSIRASGGAPRAPRDSSSSSDSDEDLDSPQVLRGRPTPSNLCKQEKMDTEEWPEMLDESSADSGPVAMETEADVKPPSVKEGWAEPVKAEASSSQEDDDDWADFTSARTTPDDVDEESRPVTAPGEKSAEPAVQSDGTWADFTSIKSEQQSESEIMLMDVQESSLIKSSKYAVDDDTTEEDLDLPPRPSAPEPPEEVDRIPSPDQRPQTPEPQAVQPDEQPGIVHVAEAQLLPQQEEPTKDCSSKESADKAPSPGSSGDGTCVEATGAAVCPPETPTVTAEAPSAPTSTASASEPCSQSSTASPSTSEAQPATPQSEHDLEENFNFISSLMSRPGDESSDAGPDHNGPTDDAQQSPKQLQHVEKIRSEAQAAAREFEATTNNGPV